MPPGRWLCISTRANADITREKHIWGVAKRFANTIARVKNGDGLLMYTTQETVDHNVIPSAITGVYKAVSEVYLDESPLFITPDGPAGEIFPLRITVEPIKVFHKPVPFKPLVPELSFIKNKVMWSGSIRSPMSVIPEEDYRKIYTSDQNWHDRSKFR